MNSSARSPEASHGESASGLPLVSAVIPCLSEEIALALCIAKAQASFAEMGICGEVVIADNGSTDCSREIATSLGVRVVIEDRKGYGAERILGTPWITPTPNECQMRHRLHEYLPARFSVGLPRDSCMIKLRTRRSPPH